MDCDRRARLHVDHVTSTYIRGFKYFVCVLDSHLIDILQSSWIDSIKIRSATCSVKTLPQRVSIVGADGPQLA